MRQGNGSELEQSTAPCLVRDLDEDTAAARDLARMQGGRTPRAVRVHPRLAADADRRVRNGRGRAAAHRDPSLPDMRHHRSLDSHARFPGHQHSRVRCADARGL